MNQSLVQTPGLSPWRVLKYAAGFTIPAVVALSFLSDGPFTWWAIAYGFGVLPLLEMVLPYWGTTQRTSREGGLSEPSDSHQTVSDPHSLASLADLSDRVGTVTWGGLVRGSD